MTDAAKLIVPPAVRANMHMINNNLRASCRMREIYRAS